MDLSRLVHEFVDCAHHLRADFRARVRAEMGSISTTTKLELIFQFAVNYEDVQELT